MYTRTVGEPRIRAALGPRASPGGRSGAHDVSKGREVVGRSDNPCITGWSAISSIGIGRRDFADALTSGRSGVKPVPRADGADMPLDEACFVPEFDTVAFLGPKGTRSMDRTTAMAVATAGMVLGDLGTSAADEPARVGIVLGTSTGSVKSITDFTRETLVQDKPYFVNPAHFPNTVMNCAAGQCAIWHKLKGVNSTVSGGLLTGLLALKYATRSMRRGYSDTVLVGAVEEFCEQLAWADYHIRPEPLRRKLPLGEGCAMFLLDTPDAARARGRAPIAEVVAFEFGVFPPFEGGRDRQRRGLAECVRRALDAAGTRPRDVWALSASGCGDDALNELEAGALDDALAGARPAHHVVVSEQVGNCFSASGAFQLAALLALAERDGGRERVALVTSVAPDGSVGCALLRV